MATIIEQKPIFNTLPVGQEIMFSVSNNNIVSTEERVKFIAEVHISNDNPINTGTTTHLIGTFKTTPNNVGVGMFDLSSIVESYVKSDNLATTGSTYKGMSTTITTQHPLHLVDKFTMSDNVMRYLAIQFKVEYFDTTTNAMVIADARNSEEYKIFNGYLKYSDQLEWTADGFGYDISRFEVDSASTGQFLTNAPLIQYATENDYGTIAYLTKIASGAASNGYLDKITIQMFDSSDSQLGSTIEIDRTTANGAYDIYSALLKKQLIFYGCYPANLRIGSTDFATQLATGNLAYYIVRGRLSSTPVTQSYRINILCPNLKGYAPIRLAWLNQWGVWDYYTFNQKSVRSISTKGSTYTQEKGTWNQSQYRVHGFKGGQKSFRVNAMERITMNTDFVTEADSEWFEELINSPEIYVLEGFQTDPTQPVLNNYVTPVRLTTSTYTRKTIANDKLMQYTFEVEKSKTLRTQSI